MLLFEALAKCVKGARSDVAVDDAECEKCEPGEARPARVGLRMGTYVMSSNGSGTLAAGLAKSWAKHQVVCRESQDSVIIWGTMVALTGVAAIRGDYGHPVVEDSMDKDLKSRGIENELRGKAKEMKGNLRGDLGDAVDDSSEHLEGRAEQLEGKIQKNFGKVEQDVDDNT
jgi:uncharacterized protein YjbJ (UPF0337 family)